jgi:hypothetical protein
VIERPRQAAARHPDRAVAAALAVLACALFAPAVLGQRLFFQRDILAYWYPHMENAVQAVGEGTWPTWTPYVSFGRPLLADPSLQLLYPPTWLNLLMRPAAYYTVFALAHLWGAGFGLYRLGRCVGLPVSAAGLAGALWMASGPMLSAVNLFHHFAGAAWMPWVLLMVARALAVPTVASGLRLGAVAGGQALAGSADMCLLTAIAAAGQGAVFLPRAPEPLTRRFRKAARVALVAAAFAALIAAAQWLPAFHLLARGARAAQSFSVTSTWSVHPASLADLLVPRLVADLPLRAEARAVLFDGRRPFLLSLYTGIAALPLVALAVPAGAHPLRRWAVLGFAFFVLAALGRHTPAYGLLLGAVPPLGLLRYPVKYMVPAALFWALLAGRGLQVFSERWTDPARGRAERLAVAAGVLAAGLLGVALWAWRAPGDPLGAAVVAGASGARGSVAGKLAAAALTLAAAGVLLRLRARHAQAAAGLTAAASALVIADVALAGRGVNLLALPALARYRPPAADRILSESALPRLHVRQESAQQLNEWLLRGPGGWDSEEGWIVGAHDLLVPPIGARWRIGGSYDGDFTGLGQPALPLFTVVLPTLGDDPFAVKLLRTGAVTHVTSLRERPYAGLEPLGVLPSVFTRPVFLHRVPDPLPRVYVVGGARMAATDHQVLAAMAEPGFDPRREVILPAAAAVHAAPAGFVGAARLTARHMDRLVADVESSAPGWLVAVEAYDPGWRARVDGRAAEVLPANALFRAVAVPAGRHRVEMTYRAPGLAPGLLLSASALALGAWAAARERARAKLNAGAPRANIPARVTRSEDARA